MGDDFIKKWMHWVVGVVFMFISAHPVLCQSEKQDSSQFRRYDIFPAISYSPETKLTLGVIGYRYLDLSKSDPETIRSFINFLAIYTTANQTLVESVWDLFTDGNKKRIRGDLSFARFPNRNYGLGNDADVLLTEYTLNDQGIEDSVVRNYKRYSFMRVRFRPAFLWELKDNFYAGVLGGFEYVWNFEELADSLNIYNGEEEIQILEDRFLGLRSGLGLSLVWDTRDYLLNSTSGSYVIFNSLFFGPYVGSKYTYSSFSLDSRKYLNPISNHSIALRGVLNYRFTSDLSLPLRGLSQVGGSKFVRGYFEGTYQNNHMAAFETEYRIPFWNEDNIAPFHQFWKRLGATVFFSGAQVYGKNEAFQFDRFNFATGAGLRILFNEESRANLRIDYAFGLSQDSAGPGKKQTGLYFFLGEAF